MALVAEIKKGKLLKLSVDRSEIPSWVTTHLLRMITMYYLHAERRRRLSTTKLPLYDPGNLDTL
jgi:hypothetical protein